MLIANTQAYSA